MTAVLLQQDKNAHNSRTGQQLKRLVGCLTVLLLTLFLPLDSATGRTYAAFVMDADTGKVLHEKNADTRTYPASLTKMMTLYLLFEDLSKGKLEMSTPLKVSARAERQPSSRLGLKNGETISVKKAIEALIVKSANDVAVVVAENLGRTEVQFAKRMTKKAQALGMSRTVFRNASGLYHSKQKSTARDLAKLGQALHRDFQQYYGFFAMKSFQYGGETVKTHNTLLNDYSGADGMKTGYIRASGFNIVTSAKRGNHRVISVVLGGNTSKWRDERVASLMTDAFQDYAFAANHIKRPPYNPENTVLMAALNGEPTENTLNGAVDTTVGEGDADTEDPILSTTSTPQSTAAMLSMVFNPETALAATEAKANLGWAVQVGAFSDATSAQSAVELAMAMQTDGAAIYARRSIEPIRSGNRTLYRARLTQLSAQDANRTCKLMQRDNHPCMTLSGR